MSQRVIIACKPKPLGVSEGKPSLNRAWACESMFFKEILIHKPQYAVIDPKRGDLGMGRLKAV